jgi:Protein of unknown function (DUF1997)
MLCSRPPSTKFSHALQFPHRHSHRHRRSLILPMTQAVTTNNNTARLCDPARLGGSSKASVPVHDYGGTQSLDTYMHLPPSHYSDLDPDLIESLGGNKFRLRVPRVKLFSLWIEPTVDISVLSANSQNPRVLLTSESCHLIGSELIQKMQLDKRFVLNFSTELTWETTSNTPKIESSNGSTSNGSTKPENSLPESQITGDLELEVFTEVIPPFQMLPRSVLEGTCNAVLRSLMKTLLPKFMQKLANDYEKWATDSEYRHGRAGAEAEAEAGMAKK